MMLEQLDIQCKKRKKIEPAKVTANPWGSHFTFLRTHWFMNDSHRTIITNYLLNLLPFKIDSELITDQNVK